jgi:two-component system, NarL family, invasion response regulator UvrY
MTSALIVDDHPIVLQGCRRVLEDAGIEPVLAASDLVAGYRLYLRHRPDVAIVDLAIQGKGLGGLELIRRIKSQHAGAHILVLSMHNDAMIVARSLEAGASGYVLKDTSSEELVKAVQQAFLSSELAVKVALTRSNVPANPLADLTPRELQVLALLAEGKPYETIADELAVSYKTVVNTSSQLKHKLKVRTLPQLIRIAVRLLAPPT